MRKTAHRHAATSIASRSLRQPHLMVSLITSPASAAYCDFEPKKIADLVQLLELAVGATSVDVHPAKGQSFGGSV